MTTTAAPQQYVDASVLATLVEHHERAAASVEHRRAELARCATEGLMVRSQYEAVIRAEARASGISLAVSVVRSALRESGS